MSLHAVAVMAMAVIALPSAGAASGTLQTLHNFCAKSNCADGAYPQSALLRDSAGNFFGTTSSGGKYGSGTVFEITAGGKEKVLHSFCGACGEGAGPLAAVIADVNGNLYGTTQYGGGAGNAGAVFELVHNPDTGNYKYKLLYSFCAVNNCADGEYPFAPLTYTGAASGLPYDGVSPLFGTTVSGGTGAKGLAFQLTRKHAKGLLAETVLHNFCSDSNCADGSQPQGPLTPDANGNLYGTTAGGGGSSPDNDVGTLYELTNTGGSYSQTVLYRFCQLTNCADGEGPGNSPVTMDSAGNLYGTTAVGGTSNAGTVFEIIPGGANSEEKVLYNFHQSDGWLANGGVAMDANGDLVGTTTMGGKFGGGVVFRIRKGAETILYQFGYEQDWGDGSHPDAPPILDSAGNVYGIASSGGKVGYGTVWKATP